MKIIYSDPDEFHEEFHSFEVTGTEVEINNLCDWLHDPERAWQSPPGVSDIDVYDGWHMVTVMWGKDGGKDAMRFKLQKC